MADIAIHRCTLRIVRRGGWSWGPAPRKLLQSAIKELPELLSLELGKLWDNVDLELTAPISFNVPIRIAELSALTDAGGRIESTKTSALQALGERIGQAARQALAREQSTTEVAPEPAAQPSFDETVYFECEESNGGAVFVVLRSWHRAGVLSRRLAAFSETDLEEWLNQLIQNARSPQSRDLAGIVIRESIRHELNDQSMDEDISSVTSRVSQRFAADARPSADSEMFERLVGEAVWRWPNPLSGRAAILRRRLIVLIEAMTEAGLSQCTPALLSALNRALPVDPFRARDFERGRISRGRPEIIDSESVCDSRLERKTTAEFAARRSAESSTLRTAVSVSDFESEATAHDGSETRSADFDIAIATGARKRVSAARHTPTACETRLSDPLRAVESENSSADFDIAIATGEGKRVSAARHTPTARETRLIDPVRAHKSDASTADLDLATGEAERASAPRQAATASGTRLSDRVSAANEREFPVAEFSGRAAKSEFLPSIAQPRQTDWPPRGQQPLTQPLRQSSRHGQSDQIASALPFLLLGPLSRIGYLRTLAATMEAANCLATLPSFAAALAYKVLAPPARGWRRGAESIATATAFAGLDQPAAEPALVEMAQQLSPRLAPLDAALSGHLIGGHCPQNPLLLLMTGVKEETGFLLLEVEGLYPIQYAASLPALLQVLIELNSIILVPESSAEPGVLRWLDHEGFRFITDAIPTRGERWRTLRRSPQQHWCTNEAIMSNSALARIAQTLRDATEEAATLWQTFVERPSIPLAQAQELDHHLTLAASVAMGIIAWELWRDREPTAPHLVIERFADLEARFTRRQDVVQVRLPLGKRFQDLRDHGLLDNVTDVPWLNGRMLTF